MKPAKLKRKRRAEVGRTAQTAAKAKKPKLKIRKERSASESEMLSAEEGMQGSTAQEPDSQFGEHSGKDREQGGGEGGITGVCMYVYIGDVLVFILEGDHSSLLDGVLDGEQSRPSALEEVLEGEHGLEDRQFASLVGLVSEKTLRAIEEMGFTEMMEIQHRTIQPLLEGRYVYMCICVYQTKAIDSFDSQFMSEDTLHFN